MLAHWQLGCFSILKYWGYFILSRVLDVHFWRSIIFPKATNISSFNWIWTLHSAVITVVNISRFFMLWMGFWLWIRNYVIAIDSGYLYVHIMWQVYCGRECSKYFLALRINGNLWYSCDIVIQCWYSILWHKFSGNKITAVVLCAIVNYLSWYILYVL